MYFRILSFIVFLTLSACSSIQPINRTIINHTPSTVDLDVESNTKSDKKNDENVLIQKPEETIRIGEKGGEVFSTNESSSTPIRFNDQSLRLGLAFGPASNRAINYISVLKVLEKNNLSPVVLTGTEMGAVVASMYAVGMTPESIEWSFYKYFKERKKYKIYEKDWLDQIDVFFLQKLKNYKIEETKKKLFLTLFDQNKNKTVYFDRGNIRDILLINFRSSTNPIKYKTGEVFSNAFEKEVFNSKLLNKMGADYTLAVDAINSRVLVEDKNEAYSILMLKSIHLMNKEKQSFSLVLNLPIKEMALDTANDSNLYQQNSFDYSNRMISSFKKKINQKKSEMDTSSENMNN